MDMMYSHHLHKWHSPSYKHTDTDTQTQTNIQTQTDTQTGIDVQTWRALIISTNHIARPTSTHRHTQTDTQTQTDRHTQRQTHTLTPAVLCFNGYFYFTPVGAQSIAAEELHIENILKMAMIIQYLFVILT